MSEKPRLGIVLTTTRPNRFGDTPARWIFELAKAHGAFDCELVDLRDYPLPLFDEKGSQAYFPLENEVAKRFSAKMRELDGYLFVTAEYNHSVTGAIKNALDFLYSEVHKKPATFVGYGAVGGARAVEHLRHVLAEMQVATLKHTVHIGRTEMLGMLREGKKMADYPYLDELAKPMLDELSWWMKTLKAGREAA
jgi:NAD(P)H-dependent FMN reductase